MLAVRLVRLIENHIEQLSRDLSEKVWSSPRCSDLNKVPATQLEARTREIYRNLSDWLMDKTEAEVERRYTELGAARAEQGVAYSHFVWAIISTKEHVRAFVQREGLSESAMELHGELELLHLLSQFFDLVLYYAAVGYEQERNRIGGRQRRRKGD
jgi:alpha-amylase/alpha-mannosidase (GH57 family)